MFSGIIEQTAKATKFTKTAEEAVITLPIPKGWIITDGDSIAIDGVCATVKEHTDTTFTFYFMPETLRKTVFATYPSDHVYNLEQPLTLQSFLGGHLVSGHVDTIAVLESIQEEDSAKVYTFSLDKSFTKYIIYKGSITINGVSLTIIDQKDDTFSVSLIPYTLSHTNLGMLQIGEKVHIEVDMIAKYIEKLLPSSKE